MSLSTDAVVSQSPSMSLLRTCSSIISNFASTCRCSSESIQSGSFSFTFSFEEPASTASRVSSTLKTLNTCAKPILHAVEGLLKVSPSFAAERSSLKNDSSMSISPFLQNTWHEGLVHWYFMVKHFPLMATLPRFRIFHMPYFLIVSNTRAEFNCFVLMTGARAQGRALLRKEDG